MQHLRIQSDGYDAYQRYEPRENNPHPQGSMQHKQWSLGWEDARFEHWQQSKFAHGPEKSGSPFLEAK